MKNAPISYKRPLILASRSPRRIQLLKQIGLPFRSIPSDMEEEHPHDNPKSTTVKLAQQKALQVSKRTSGHWILGADTLVVVGRTPLGKPSNEIHARAMLKQLRGKTHRVITGFCLVGPDGELRYSEAITTQVKVKPLSDQEIEDYIKTGEPFGKAGSYAIQGIGAFMIESINGSYTNVVGLPLCALIKALLSVEALLRFPLAQG